MYASFDFKSIFYSSFQFSCSQVRLLDCISAPPNVSALSAVCQMYNQTGTAEDPLTLCLSCPLPEVSVFDHLDALCTLCISSP